MIPIRVQKRDGLQIIELPEGYQFSGETVFAEKRGNELVLRSENDVRKEAEDALNSFSSDFGELVEESRILSAVPGSDVFQ